MKLYEFEGHRIFSKVGLASPFFVVASNLEEVEEARKRLKFPIVAKVQVLSGKRGKGGGIKVATSEKALADFCGEMFGSQFPPSPHLSLKLQMTSKATEGQGAGEEVRFISLAEKVNIEAEHYISITYDTVLKIPFLIFSEDGGMDIEEVKKTNPDKIIRVNIDPFLGPNEKELLKAFGKNQKLVDVAMRLWDAFWRYDARLVEINPLAKVNVIASGSEAISKKIAAGSSSPRNDNGEYLAVDAKVILDDSALVRHKDLDVMPKGTISSTPSAREIEAKKIDEEDYRGSAGSTFIELDGDIAILASGGGASLIVMDSLYEAGGKAANYTEYSGNPPGEKVEKLTRIALSRQGLAGCLVAGAVANFTDIYETLSGFVRGLGEVKPKVDYPIVIRRGGPRQEEAYEMLREFAKKEGYDIHLFGPDTPISTAAKKMVELAEEYKDKINRGSTPNRG